jgi:hypothetical protein
MEEKCEQKVENRRMYAQAQPPLSKMGEAAWCMVSQTQLLIIRTTTIADPHVLRDSNSPS